MNQTFSKRLGYPLEPTGIEIREDAPPKLREALLVIAEGELGISPRFLRTVLCRELRQTPDPNSWSEYPNVWEECQNLIGDCAWYKVYDFVEALHRRLMEEHKNELAEQWEDRVNDHFAEMGVGWKFVDGILESRGPETFEVAVERAKEILEEGGLPAARQEIHEALRDISRRPEPDLTGAIQHAMAALECTMREKIGNKNATLGQLLKKNADTIPKPLDTAIEKMWGYACETGRHLRESQSPGREEVELIVTVSAAACTYLASIMGD